MISRYFVILFAAGTAVFTGVRHEWAQTVGLASLAIGLMLLRVAHTQAKPQFVKIAWVFFAVTLVVLGIVIQQKFLH